MKACVFCEILAGRSDAAVIHRDSQCIVLLDAFPLTRGHLLLIPLAHAERIEELPAATVEHLFRLGARYSAAWMESGDANATNLMLNNGRAANQHVAHVHLHVIPRRQGDSFALVLRYLTRFINPWSYIGRARRLEREAQRLRSLLATATTEHKKTA